MFIKRSATANLLRSRSAGFTLIETLFTVGVVALGLGALVSFFMFSSHSFVTLFNYADLDEANRIAMDQLTRDVRQANSVTSFTTNNLVLQDSDGLPLTYTYDAAGRTLSRSKSGDTKVVLTECDRLNFVVCQRNPVNGTYDVYPTATPATAKVINVSWMCSRTVFGFKEDTESVQTARIVIRKQGT